MNKRYVLLIVCGLLSLYGYGQNLIVPFENIHPTAKVLFTDKFFLSTTEETAPFGNTIGKEAFTGFKEWRKIHRNESPVVYLSQYINGLHYPAFDLKTMHLDKLSEYVSSHPSGAEMLTNQDNAVIAVGFGQLMMEGKIEEELKQLTEIALHREILPVIIEHSAPEYHATRREQLTKLLEVVYALSAKE